MSSTSASSSSSTRTGRKNGLNLLQSPIIRHLRDGGYEVVVEAEAEMKPADVETFLDDNSCFLDEYVSRKASRSQLEKWLFRNVTGKNHNFLANSANQQQQQEKIRRTCRQRSRSFTPLRKLSASKFEESGLSTPILVTDVDGQPSFLRRSSAARPLHSPTFDQKTNNNNNGHGVTSTRVREAAAGGKQSIFDVLEDVFREKEVSGVITQLGRGIKSLLSAEHFCLLITDHAFSGNLHTLDAADNYHKEKATADRIMTGVITSRQTFNVPHPDSTAIPEGNSASLVAPVVVPHRGGKVMGVARIARLSTSSKKAFSNEDENIFNLILRFAAICLTNALERREMRLELTRSEVFLELAHAVFAEPSRIEPTIRTILSNFLTMIVCERCQILLTDPNDPRIFKRVFQMQRGDLNEEAEDEEIVLEGRFPILAVISGDVAVAGRKVNIADVQADERFDAFIDSADDPDGLTHRSLLCLPIRDSPDTNRVLGVISLINKDDGGGVFTENDERFAEAFSLFCGMAIRNAAEFEVTVLSEAKLQVAFETMNYQASSSCEEAAKLAVKPVPSAATLGVDSLSFSYLGLSDDETFLSVIRMFTDLGLLSGFHIEYETFCRWVLTVKKNYRNDTVPYHNWYHAFNVCQMIFCMLKQTQWDKKVFSKIENLAMMIATICHDLDHRGTTNSFQIKAKNSLATLYSSSTLERHHLNQCLLLLNIPGNRILENLNETEYSTALSVIERCILATDLAHHFRHAKQIHEMAANADASNLKPGEKDLLQCLLMTGSDLGAVSKPWKVHLHVGQLVAEEFWAQGDLEREAFDETPVPMMDRQASLALVQIDFINNVCKGVFGDLAALDERLQELSERCDENSLRWAEESDKQPNNNNHNEQEEEEEVQSAGHKLSSAAARNL